MTTEETQASSISLSDETWAACEKWVQENWETLKIFREADDRGKELFYVLAESFFARTKAVLDEQAETSRQWEAFATQVASVADSIMRETVKAEIEKYSLTAAANKQKLNLALGRPLGVKKRQEIAARKQSGLDKIICDLLNGTEGRGLATPNKEMIVLIDKSGSGLGYSDETILKAIKRIKKERKARSR